MEVAKNSKAAMRWQVRLMEAGNKTKASVGKLSGVKSDENENEFKVKVIVWISFFSG